MADLDYMIEDGGVEEQNEEVTVSDESTTRHKSIEQT